MASLARKFCGRRQDEEGPHEEVLLPGQEARGHIRQETIIAHPPQKEVFEAIEQCDLVRIKNLLKECSFKDIKDIHLRTPLHVLADVKPEEKKVKDEDLKKIFMVLKEAGCDVNCVDEYGNTAVKLAAEKGCIQVLKCLLEEKADIEISDKFKQDTPLHWAAKNGMFEATKLLIEHRAHLNPQNKDKQTPLHLAVHKKHIKIVYLLLLAGADKKLKDKNDFTPLCIATRAENKEIVELLNKSEEELLTMQLLDEAEYDMKIMHNEESVICRSCRLRGITLFEQTKDGQGEYVEPDSGVSTMDYIPFTKVGPSKLTQINISYNVNVEGQATAAIGPHARVIHDFPPTPSSSTAGSPIALSPAPEAQQLLPPTPSPSTAGSPIALSPAPEAQQLLPPTPSPSTAGSPIALSPAPEAQQLLPPTPSPSTAGSPIALSPAPEAQQLLPPTPSPSTAGSPTASSPAAEAQQLFPPTPSPSTAGSPIALSPAPEAQQLLPPTPSPSTAGSPTASSPAAEAQQLFPPTPSSSTAGSPIASSPAVVVPTAPLSPLSMDILRPLPSAPLVEEEDVASRGR